MKIVAGILCFIGYGVIIAAIIDYAPSKYAGAAAGLTVVLMIWSLMEISRRKL